MGKSYYLANAVINGVLGGSSYSQPGTVYLAAFTTIPTQSNTGGIEPSGGSYSRVSITNNPTNWPTAVSGAKSNGVQFNFTTATGSWGTIVGFGLFDDPSTGNLLYYGPLTTPKVITTGSTLSFNVGSLTMVEV